jgi:hypothetical protein
MWQTWYLAKCVSLERLLDSCAESMVSYSILCFFFALSVPSKSSSQPSSRTHISNFPSSPLYLNTLPSRGPLLDNRAILTPLQTSSFPIPGSCPHFLSSSLSPTEKISLSSLWLSHSFIMVSIYTPEGWNEIIHSFLVAWWLLMSWAQCLVWRRQRRGCGGDLTFLGLTATFPSKQKEKEEERGLVEDGEAKAGLKEG